MFFSEGQVEAQEQRVVDASIPRNEERPGDNSVRMHESS